MYLFIVQISRDDQQTIQFTSLLMKHTCFTISSPLLRNQHLHIAAAIANQYNLDFLLH